MVPEQDFAQISAGKTKFYMLDIPGTVASTGPPHHGWRAVSDVWQQLEVRIGLIQAERGEYFLPASFLHLI